MTWGAPATLARLGLTKALTVVGMVAEQLAIPARPLPEVETRRINDTQGRLALADRTLPPTTSQPSGCARPSLAKPCGTHRYTGTSRMWTARPCRRPLPCRSTASSTSASWPRRAPPPPRSRRTRHAPQPGGRDPGNRHHTVTDAARLQRSTQIQGRGILALDSLQPDVGHEVLWVLRGCISRAVLLTRSLPSATCVEGGLARAAGLSYDGPRTDIGLCLTGWQAYEISDIETFASRYLRSKLSQALAGQEAVSPVMLSARRIRSHVVRHVPAPVGYRLSVRHQRRRGKNQKTTRHFTFERDWTIVRVSGRLRFWREFS